MKPSATPAPAGGSSKVAALGGLAGLVCATTALLLVFAPAPLMPVGSPAAPSASAVMTSPVPDAPPVDPAPTGSPARSSGPTEPFDPLRSAFGTPRPAR